MEARPPPDEIILWCHFATVILHRKTGIFFVDAWPTYTSSQLCLHVIPGPRHIGSSLARSIPKTERINIDRYIGRYQYRRYIEYRFFAIPTVPPTRALLRLMARTNALPFLVN
jgi:hypothetical protein